MKARWDSYRYFKRHEFDSPDAPGSGENMQHAFMVRLETAREISGVQYEINSGFRTPAYNLKAGGKPGSAHLKGWGCDIRAVESMIRHRVLDGLIKAGFNRIGIAKTFIHADSDPSLPPGVVWLY